MAQTVSLTRRAFLIGDRHLAKQPNTDAKPEGGQSTLAISDDCLARSGVTCMTCRDICPEQAIRMRPRLGGPFLPEIDDDACTRCGACVDTCPADAVSLQSAAEGKANA